MKPTDDLRVKGYQQLMEPNLLKQELAISPAAHTTVSSGRDAIEKILNKEKHTSRDKSIISDYMFFFFKILLYVDN